VSDMTPTPPEPILEPGNVAVPSSVAGAGSAIRGFLSTTVGKVVVIASAVGMLLVIVGIVGALVLLNLGKQAIQKSTVTLAPAANAAGMPGQAVAATGSLDATPPPKVVVPVTDKDVFVARDPFEPVIKESGVTSASISATASTEASPTAAELGTMTLQDIISADGVYSAILLWDGKQYTVAAGDQVGTSPWKVLSITKTGVTMLFGDVQVTLSIGEGVAK
jgi:hypothetical protein